MGRRVGLVIGVAVWVSAGADAASLVRARPGLMCRSAAALAALTLPDGSNRATSARAHPGDEQTMRDGGCIDIPAASLDVVTARKNTSIVRYDAGGGMQTYYVPNIDMQPAGAVNSRMVAGRPDFWELMARNCPQRHWDRAVAASFEGPLDDADRVLTPAQSEALENDIAAHCGGAGMSCPNMHNVDLLLSSGHAREVVRAFCAAQPVLMQ